MHIFRCFGWLICGCFIAGAGCTPRPDKPVSGPNRLLTQFAENGRWGYLDSTGIVVLRPRFWSAGAFSEGLAPVREGGLYGYIDQQGRYVLPPAYEYATEFQAGRAIVWQANRPWLIDGSGRNLTPPGTYHNLQWVLDEQQQPVALYADGTTRHQGLLNCNGRQLVDTVYSRVNYLGAGRFELRQTQWTRIRTTPGSRTDTTTYLEEGETNIAVSDGRGHLIVPFGRYHAVSSFSDGRAIADLPAASPNAEYSDMHLLDSTGQVVGRLSGQAYTIGSSDAFHDGLLVVSLRPKQLYDVVIENVPAVLDRQGHLLFADSSLESISPYCRGLAWAETKTREWYLIDKMGHRLNRRPFGQPVGPNLGNEVAPTFNHGVEAIRVDSSHLLLINSSGRAVGPARRIPFAYDDVLREGNILFFSISKELPKDEYDTRSGYWDLTTDLLFPPRFQLVGSSYYHGLLQVKLNNRSAYLSRTGHFAWQQSASPEAGRQRNSDIMNRAVYTVASPDVPRLRHLSGWAPSGNLAHSLPGAPTTAGQLRVSVATAVADTLYAHRFAGHRLCISNATADTILFNGQDSMLNLILQARDRTGAWRDIEYLPRTFCGNSYHMLFLAPGQYWNLAVPAYAGSQPTQLRAKLTPRSNWRTPKAARVWYSNVFEGSVNPAQFWRQPGYAFSSDIMNPYLN